MLTLLYALLTYALCTILLMIIPDYWYPLSMYQQRIQHRFTHYGEFLYSSLALVVFSYYAIKFNISYSSTSGVSIWGVLGVYIVLYTLVAALKRSLTAIGLRDYVVRISSSLMYKAKA